MRLRNCLAGVSQRSLGDNVVFVTGASGFVGGHLVRSLVAAGHRVRCLARSEKARSVLQPLGVEIIDGDITDRESLSGVVDAGAFVVHLVGIIEERGGATFQKVHVDGTANLLAEAAQAKAGHVLFQSALGANGDSWSAYLKTKAMAEDLVRESGIPWTILRPSLIIGPWDGFTLKLAEMVRLSPVLPIPGRGDARFQPLYIKDWVRCSMKVLDEPSRHQALFEIGGPEHLTYEEIVVTLAAVMGHRRPVVHVPMGLMKLGAAFLDRALPSPPVTPDQLRLLEQDNTTDPDAVERNFGFTPMRFEDALREFLGERS